MKFWLIGTAGLLSCVFADANPVSPSHFTDIWYNWPSKIENAQVTMQVAQDPGPRSAYYWSHFFTFQNSNDSTHHPELDSAGYMGLQTNGKGKDAIFSVWNALATKETYCKRFGGEGVGFQCIIPYPFIKNHRYTFLVTHLPTQDPTGDWWEGRVIDESTHQVSVIGTIKALPGSGSIFKSVLFDEYFGQAANCSKLPKATIAFTRLLGNNATITPMLTGHYEGRVCTQNIAIRFQGNDVMITTGESVSTLNASVR